MAWARGFTLFSLVATTFVAACSQEVLNTGNGATNGGATSTTSTTTGQGVTTGAGTMGAAVTTVSGGQSTTSGSSTTSEPTSSVTASTGSQTVGFTSTTGEPTTSVTGAGFTSTTGEPVTSSTTGLGATSTGGAGGTGTTGETMSTAGDSTTGGESTGSPGNYPMGNPAVPSAGCGQATNLMTGEATINSTNQNRVYWLDIPSGYDMNKPYRLFYISHWIGSRYQDMVNNNFYHLKTLAEAAGEPAIFVAPSSDGATWQEKDHALFDDLLALIKENLCIDTSRVFATGFSFGGMITYSLSTNHQSDIRAAVGIAPANYNIWLPQKTREPIAWMQTTGMGDGTCPWVNGSSSTQGAKFLAEEKAEDNNCTPAEVPTWQNGNHVCYDYAGCDPEHPTKVCTFNGGHVAENSDQGSNANWIAEESWDFFSQF